MAHADERQSFAPNFDRDTPAYLWWNGQQVPWESATVHLTSMFWSGVTAIFEGIMSYWNEEAGELYIWQLDAHLRRLLRSQKLMRAAPTRSLKASAAPR
jgi:branched-chain amino acid aminotransferase